MTLRNPQSVNQPLQRAQCCRVLLAGQALIGEVGAIDDLRLIVGVAEPVAIGGQDGDAAHEKAVVIARLPVVRVVNADSGADVPVEMSAVDGSPHGCSRQNRNRNTVRRAALAGAGHLYKDVA